MSNSPESGTKPGVESKALWDPLDLQYFCQIIEWKLWWGPELKRLPRTVRRSRKISAHVEDLGRTELWERLEKSRNRFMRKQLWKDEGEYVKNATCDESIQGDGNPTEDLERRDTEE